MREMAMQDTSFGVLTGNNVATKFVKAGGVIFSEGEEASELFVIKSGEVRIQLGNRTLTELRPDSIFGEMALIDNEPRSATAIAITDVEIVPIGERQFLFLVSQTPYFALQGDARAGAAPADEQQDVWLDRQRNQFSWRQ
jgi:CRP/FNR family transcriptional regulator, cyclic AMP receptor protein